MRRTASHVCVIVAVFLAACAQTGMRTAATPFRCTTQQCVVTVSVPACDAISVDRDPLHVAGVKNADIVWKVATPGYVFAPQGQGISLKQPSAQFSNPRRTDSEYRLSNANSAKGRHEYNIVLKHGNQTCAWDPVIVNEP